MFGNGKREKAIMSRGKRRGRDKEKSNYMETRNE